MEKFKFLSKDKISSLPETAGVYMFKNGRRILYVGKAINIRKRVKQHRAVLNQVKHIAYIETGSEFVEPSAHLTSHPTSRGSTIEALLLESRLIKRYQPKYNVAWKDDKNYFYVEITKDPLPRVLTTHRASGNGSEGKDEGKPEGANFIASPNLKFIGPFVDGSALKQTLKILRKIFPYYTQKKHPNKLCPWCHLNLCPGPNPDPKEYRKNIKNLVLFLKGKKKSVLINLKEEMTEASKKEDYEKAARFRDQISALENVFSHYARKQPWYFSDVWRKRIEAYDVSNIQGQHAVGSMVVFSNGKPDKNQYRKFKIKIAGKPNDTAMLKEIIARRFNHSEWPYPDLILIDGGKAQLNAALSVTRKLDFLRRVGAHVERSEMWGKARIKSGFRVMALAKKHNELFVEGKKKPLLLENLPREIFNLILQLRDEAHRFAISYHKKLREKYLVQ